MRAITATFQLEQVVAELCSARGWCTQNVHCERTYDALREEEIVRLVARFMKVEDINPYEEPETWWDHLLHDLREVLDPLQSWVGGHLVSDSEGDLTGNRCIVWLARTLDAVVRFLWSHTSYRLLQRNHLCPHLPTRDGTKCVYHLAEVSGQFDVE